MDLMEGAIPNIIVKIPAGVLDQRLRAALVAAITGARPNAIAFRPIPRNAHCAGWRSRRLQPATQMAAASGYEHLQHLAQRA